MGILDKFSLEGKLAQLSIYTKNRDLFSRDVTSTLDEYDFFTEGAVPLGYASFRIEENTFQSASLGGVTFVPFTRLEETP